MSEIEIDSESTKEQVAEFLKNKFKLSEEVKNNILKKTYLVIF